MADWLEFILPLQQQVDVTSIKERDKLLDEIKEWLDEEQQSDLNGNVNSNSLMKEWKLSDKMKWVISFVIIIMSISGAFIIKHSSLETSIITPIDDVDDKREDSNENKYQLHRGWICDSDGWTNVRAEPSRSSMVVLQLNDGQEILYHSTESGWFEIYDISSGEMLGYVHKSRIRMDI